MNSETECAMNNRKDDKEKIKIKAFGFEVEVTGKQIMSSVFSLSVAVALIGSLYVHDKNTMEAFNKMIKVNTALVYMIKLDQPSRDKLDLDKPELILEMERRASRDIYTREDRK